MIISVKIWLDYNLFLRKTMLCLGLRMDGSNVTRNPLVLGRGDKGALI